MHWFKRNRWKAGIALAGMLPLLVLLVWVPVSAARAYERASGLAISVTTTVQATPTEDATVTALNKEKLQHENDWWWNYGATILSSFLTTLVLVGGALIGFWQWRVNRKDTQKKESEDQRTAQDRELEDRQAERERREEEQQHWLEDRQAERERREEEQQHWLKDQEAEREKQAEERFQKVVEGLGSERTEAKVGAAITLRTFLQPGYERFYRQAFDLAVAHLRLRKAEASAYEPPGSLAQVLIIPKRSLLQEQQPPPPTASIPLDSLSQALITVFKESFPRARREELKKVNAQFDPQLLDATGVRLDHAYLVGADLEQAWLAGASLREANLSLAQFQGANLSLAQFQGANLNGAQFQGADLVQAQFQGADLRQAQLEGANLWNAQLEEAYLEQAQLQGAHLEQAQLKRAHLGGAQLEEAHLWQAQLQGADLGGADLSKAHLEGADLSGAQLQGTNPEDADSLKDTKMNGIIGLTPEQREKCIKKGAIFDDGPIPTYI